MIETYAARRVRFFAPDVSFHDARKYLPPLLMKHKKPDVDVSAALKSIQSMIEPLEPDLYGVHVDDARRRLRERDEDDWPVLASALALACPIWTEDADFFGTGIAVWTTRHIEIYLEAQAKAHEGGGE